MKMLSNLFYPKPSLMCYLLPLLLAKTVMDYASEIKYETLATVSDNNNSLEEIVQ